MHLQASTPLPETDVEREKKTGNLRLETPWLDGLSSFKMIWVFLVVHVFVFLEQRPENEFSLLVIFYCPFGT